MKILALRKDPSSVDHLSIHDSFSRFVTVHGTHEATVSNCVGMTIINSYISPWLIVNFDFNIFKLLNFKLIMDMVTGFSSKMVTRGLFFSIYF